MSGRDARWEFPKQLLFARTNYMADICSDLIEMVEIVDDFFKFLGPELKAVTGGCGSRCGSRCGERCGERCGGERADMATHTHSAGPPAAVTHSPAVDLMPGPPCCEFGPWIPSVADLVPLI